MKNQRILSAALAVLMAGSLAACGGGAAGSAPASDTSATSSAASASQAAPVDEYKQYKGGDVVLATDAVFNNFFTPYQAGNAIAWGSFCMEPLGKKIQGTADDYDLVLAESFDVDEENFLVTIQVKQGIKFHDGTPLTAEDVAWTIQSWIDYGRGAQIGNPTEVRQTGDYTVEVQYPEFNVNYKTWLLPMQIFCKHTFDTIGLDAMMTSFNGTGPYVMDTYVEDYSLSFTRNEDYWQEHDWGPDTVTFLYTSDATSMAASVLNGDVDYMVMDAPETMELFEANGWELVPQFANAGNVSFVIPITNVPDDPWSNVKVREAVFSHGIDLVGAAAAIVGEAGYHTDAIGYKEATYYDEGLEFASLDYELAKKMLAEAGYPDGFKTRIVADATTQTQATVIQAELKKLGIEAEVEMPDMNEMQKFWTGENTAGGLMVGAMYFADPILDRLDKFYGPYGYMAGCTDWTDEEYALYDNIRSAKSIEEQDELIYKFCVQFVQKDFHFLPIANAVGRAAVSDRLILGNMASLGISYWNPNMVGCKN